MRLPGSCVWCLDPLPDGSQDELCPKCRSAPDTSRHGSATPVSILARGVTPTDPPATVAFEPDRETDSGDFSVSVATTADTAPAEPQSGPPVVLPPAPGGYDLFRRLGGGGMADVFLAREHAAERLVAIKFLRAAGNPAAVDRFLAEVRALARIDHPHIVRVYAADFYRLQPYFTMEYAPGGTLAEHIHRHGPLTAADAARVMVTVARAVAAAHTADVLHRDLKPSNILLGEGVTSEGTGGGRDATAEHTPNPSTLTPKVSDFGLAKRTDRDDGLTQGTGSLGTPSYMPPEQISRRNGEVGPRSDVYGLGATLYHLVTGRPPFTGGTPEEIMTAVLAESPVRPRAVRPEIPLPLEAVVVRCLEKDPADRYPSAAAVADDLERCLVGQRPVAPQLTRWRRTRRWASRNRVRFAAAILTVGLATGLVFAGRALVHPPTPAPQPDPAEEIRKELAAGRSVTLVGKTGLPGHSIWRLGGTTFGRSPTQDGSCYFQSIGPALLELLDDPGIDRYTLSAELMYIDSASPLTQGYGGVYCGFAEFAGAGGAPEAGCYGVVCRDVVAGSPSPPTASQVRVLEVVWKGRPGGFQLANPRQFASLPIPLLANRPGPWRTVAIDIRPEGVRVRWRPDPAAGETVLAELARLDPARFTVLTPSKPGRPLRERPVPPGWSPRAPLGIWVHQCAFAFRNVVLTPIP